MTNDELPPPLPSPPEPVEPVEPAAVPVEPNEPAAAPVPDWVAGSAPAPDPEWAPDPEPQEQWTPAPDPDPSQAPPSAPPRPTPPIYAKLRKAGIAASAGALVGLIITSLIVVWSYTSGSLSAVKVPGAAADLLAGAFGGQFGQSLKSSVSTQVIELNIQGSLWVVALIVALTISTVARFFHHKDTESKTPHLWAQAALTGGVFAIVIGILTILPSTVAKAGDATITTHSSVFPALLYAFGVGTAGYALGLISKKHGGPARLSLKMPSWLRIPSFAVALHVMILLVTSTLVTTAYALTTTFSESSPATVIRLDGANALIALTGLGGWGHVDPDVSFAALPGLGSTVTAVTGHPIWMMAITLIVTILAFFVASITLHLRRPIGRAQWNGIGITLGLYAVVGIVLLLLARTSGSIGGTGGIGPDMADGLAYVSPSWWSLVAVIGMGLAVECSSRFIAPKVLELMPGIVRKYGKVPGPDVTP